MKDIYIRVYTNAGFFDMKPSGLEQLKSYVLSDPHAPRFIEFPLALGGSVTYRTDMIEGWEEMDPQS